MHIRNVNVQHTAMLSVRLSDTLWHYI